ncbi:MAG: helix-hairpin-helix domain-containing protein [Thermodesulfobacteriota bacterium]|nr:helix-hairpin-helix domain-containing protein [Thermodesulfobacteriota bacterium]
MKKVSVMVFGVVCLMFAVTGISQGAELEGRLNINTATVEELQMLPGIGEVTSNNIVTFRDANGPFDSADELIKVSGIGDKRLDEIRPYIILEGLSTLKLLE